MQNEMGGGSGQDHAGPCKPSGGCGVPPEGSAQGVTLRTYIFKNCLCRGWYTEKQKQIEEEEALEEGLIRLELLEVKK